MCITWMVSWLRVCLCAQARVCVCLCVRARLCKPVRVCAYVGTSPHAELTLKRVISGDSSNNL
jgi:hypothetical protein